MNDPDEFLRSWFQATRGIGASPVFNPLGRWLAVYFGGALVVVPLGEARRLIKGGAPVGMLLSLDSYSYPDVDRSQGEPDGIAELATQIDGKTLTEFTFDPKAMTLVVAFSGPVRFATSPGPATDLFWTVWLHGTELSCNRLGALEFDSTVASST